MDRLNSGPTVDRVGVDYAGPILTRLGPVRKPVITKTYITVLVWFSVKAVHFEPVSDLTTAAFITTLCRFVTRWGKPLIIWSEHRTNFVGAARLIKDLITSLKEQNAQ